MTDVFHVHPDLVCSPGFKNTFNKRNITKSFQHFIMCNGFFSMIAFRIGFKLFTVALMSAYMRLDRSFVIFHISPYQGMILSADGMIKELFGKLPHGYICFGKYQ